MRGHSVVGGWVDELAPFTTDVHTVARTLARREDERLVRLVVSAAGLPFPVSVVSRPDLFALQVRVPGHTLATLTRETVDRAADSTMVAVHLGRQARRAWFATPALPVPSNVVLGEN